MIVHLRLSAQIKEEQDSDNHEITDAWLWGWTVYFECEDVWCYWDSNPALSVRVWMQLRPTSLQGSRFRVLTGSQPGMSPRRRHWLTGVLAFCMLSLLSCDLEFLMKYFWVQSVLWWFNWEVRQICSSLLHHSFLLVLVVVMNKSAATLVGVIGRLCSPTSPNPPIRSTLG